MTINGIYGESVRRCDSGALAEALLEARDAALPISEWAEARQKAERTRAISEALLEAYLINPEVFALVREAEAAKTAEGV